MDRKKMPAIVLLVAAAVCLILGWQHLQPYMDEDWLSIRTIVLIFLPGAILAALGIWLLCRD